MRARDKKSYCHCTILPIGAFPCSRPKFLENFGREHSVTVRIRCWVQDGLWSDQSCPLSNFNSSVRAEQSFAIRYLNVVIKPLCSNLDICLNYRANAYFRSRNSVRVLRSQIATERERCFFGSRFSVALLHNLAYFATEIHFGREKPEHTNAPNI